MKSRDACEICGNPCPYAHQYVCSPDCSRERKRRIDRERYYRRAHNAPRTRVCRECGTLFTTSPPDRRRKFCKEKCTRRHRAKRPQVKDRKNRSAGQARRSRIRQKQMRGIDRIAILERDRWTCQICGCPTPKSLRGSTNPRAPECAHIVSIAAGGDGSPSNLQCECRQCNNEKGVADASRRYSDAGQESSGA